MICKECGSKIRKKQDYCKACGANIDIYIPQDDKQNLFIEIINIFISICLILISSIAIVFYWFKGMPIIMVVLISIICFITSLFISKDLKEIKFIGRLLDITLFIMAIINIISIYK